jgi:hypothetical protein
VLYLIMGVGMGIAARWMPVLERGGFSPIPFFYVMGGSLVFLFLTWHIPSVASAMMAGAVHLSIADVYYPAMLAARAGAAGLATAGALFTLGRWGHSRVREWATLHTGGRGGAGTSGAQGGSPLGPSGPPSGPVTSPASEAPSGGNCRCGRRYADFWARRSTERQSHIERRTRDAPKLTRSAFEKGPGMTTTHSPFLIVKKRLFALPQVPALSDGQASRCARLSQGAGSVSESLDIGRTS